MLLLPYNIHPLKAEQFRDKTLKSYAWYLGNEKEWVLFTCYYYAFTAKLVLSTSKYVQNWEHFDVKFLRNNNSK